MAAFQGLPISSFTIMVSVGLEWRWQQYIKCLPIHSIHLFSEFLVHFYISFKPLLYSLCADIFVHPNAIHSYYEIVSYDLLVFKFYFNAYDFAWFLYWLISRTNLILLICLTMRLSSLKTCLILIVWALCLSTTTELLESTQTLEVSWGWHLIYHWVLFLGL